LEALGKDGKPLGSCPLKHTDVTADIAGFIGRVTVRQEFYNSFQHKIGRGEVQYILSPEQAAGFKELTRRTRPGKFVLGSIHVEKLDALAALAEVERIEPAPRNESR